MFEIFLTVFPACLLFCTMAFIVIDEWTKQDKAERVALSGRAVQFGNVIRVFEKEPECEGYTVVAEYDIRSYFDELPGVRRI